MIIRHLQCPHCASHEIVRIPALQTPMSSTYLLLLGWYSLILPPALPSRFRCERCTRTFRRYTVRGWLYIALLISLVAGQFFVYLLFVLLSALKR